MGSEEMQSFKEEKEDFKDEDVSDNEYIEEKPINLINNPEFKFKIYSEKL